jgi:hypothetical protein
VYEWAIALRMYHQPHTTTHRPRPNLRSPAIALRMYHPPHTTTHRPRPIADRQTTKGTHGPPPTRCPSSTTTSHPHDPSPIARPSTTPTVHPPRCIANLLRRGLLIGHAASAAGVAAVVAAATALLGLFLRVGFALCSGLPSSFGLRCRLGMVGVVWWGGGGGLVSTCRRR